MPSATIVGLDTAKNVFQVHAVDSSGNSFSNLRSPVNSHEEGHASFVYSAAFSPDGQRVVTASGDKTARVWNAATGQVIARLEGHASFVYSAAFSPDGQRVVTASWDKTARTIHCRDRQISGTGNPVQKRVVGDFKREWNRCGLHHILNTEAKNQQCCEPKTVGEKISRAIVSVT